MPIYDSLFGRDVDQHLLHGALAAQCPAWLVPYQMLERDDLCQLLEGSGTRSQLDRLTSWPFPHIYKSLPYNSVSTRSIVCSATPMRRANTQPESSNEHGTRRGLASQSVSGGLRGSAPTSPGPGNTSSLVIKAKVEEEGEVEEGYDDNDDDDYNDYGDDDDDERDDDDEDQDQDEGVADEEVQEGPPREKTVAERLAEKRRMKRFRLTSNQTRFLMSEFARQPHPDAAQRARLSKDIPGLSPRQVQVWFQNRRAKLKRLTTEGDRESTLRSRVLPEDFDTSHILNPGQGQGFIPLVASVPESDIAVYHTPTSEAFTQSHMYREHTKAESARPTLIQFPPETLQGLPSGPTFTISPTASYASMGSCATPEGQSRPRSSPSGLNRPRRMTYGQAEYLTQSARDIAPQAMMYSGGMRYVPFETSIEAAPMSRQRAYSDYAQGHSFSRTLPSATMYFGQNQSRHYPPQPSPLHTEHSQEQDLSEPELAQSPQSSTASMGAYFIPIPSTLRPFSRQYEHSTVPRSDNFSTRVNTSSEAVLPVLTDTHSETYTPHMVMTPNSAPTGDARMSPTGRAPFKPHDPLHAGIESYSPSFNHPSSPVIYTPLTANYLMAPTQSEVGTAVVEPTGTSIYPHSSRHGTLTATRGTAAYSPSAHGAETSYAQLLETTPGTQPLRYEGQHSQAVEHDLLQQQQQHQHQHQLPWQYTSPAIEQPPAAAKVGSKRRREQSADDGNGGNYEITGAGGGSTGANARKRRSARREVGSGAGPSSKG